MINILTLYTFIILTQFPTYKLYVYFIINKFDKIKCFYYNKNYIQHYNKNCSLASTVLNVVLLTYHAKISGSDYVIF